MTKTTICALAGIFAITGVAAMQPGATSFAQVRVVVAEPANLVQTLQQSYITLSAADHDYDGHRAAAMKEIAAAAGALGGSITGDGRGHEAQAMSDLQIRSVQMDLLGVGRASPAGARHGELVGHINGAIHQLSLALAYEANPKARPSGRVEVVEDVIGSNAIETGSLQRIYEVLSVANHDYKGHRASAMEHIAKACKTLGGSISGDGKGKENQAVSDKQLIQAQTLLVQVRDSFATSDPKKVLKEMDGAVSELSTALSIK